RVRNAESPALQTPASRRATLPKRIHWNGTRVLVTGASGFVGTQLIAKLLEAGASVAAVSRTPLPKSLILHPRVFAVQLDLGSEKPFDREVETFQPEVIFHLASRPDGPELENHAAN